MDKKNWVLIIGAIITVIMLLFPPFQFQGESGVVLNKGYHLIFSPPQINRVAYGTVNVGTLAIQLVVIWVICGGIYFLWKK